MKANAHSFWVLAAQLAVAVFPVGAAEQIDFPDDYDLMGPPFAAPSAATNVTLKAPPAAPPADTHMSAWYNELLKLAQAGISSDVLFAYIDNTPGTFTLGPDEIIRLRDLGVSNDVITAALNHDQEIKSGARDLPASTVPPVELPKALKLISAAPTPSAPEAAQAQPEPVMEDLAPQPVIEESEPAPGAGLVHGYPVREPQAVRLTAPILFVNSEGPPPNVIIIERLR